jgi:ABC-2 type transport system permease protein
VTAEAARSVAIRIEPQPGVAARLTGLGSVFGKSVRDGRLIALALGLVAGGIMLAGGAAMAAEWPDLPSRLALIASLELLPPVLRGLLGDPIGLDRLGGFLSWRFGNVAPVLLGIWSVLAMSGALAAEAKRGSLDVVASTPVGRRGIAIQKVLGHAALVAVAMLIAAVLTSVAGLAFGTVPGDEIPLPNALAAWTLTGVLMLAAGSVAFVAALVLGRTRGAAVGAAALFGGYLVTSYSSLAPSLEALEPLSWFAWTSGHRPLAGTWDWAPVLVLAALAAALYALGIVAFERRDIGAVAGAGRRGLPGLPAGSGSPFVRQLADRVADAIGWGIGIGAYGVLVASSADAFVEMLDQMPGIDDMIGRIYPGLDIRDPSAILELAFVAFGSLLVGLAGAGFVAGVASDENGRRIDFVLSTQLTRAQWFLATGLAAFTAVAVTTLVAGSLIAPTVSAVGGNPIDPFLGSAVLALYGCAFVGIGLALVGLGAPRLAAITAGAVSIASYLLGTLGNALRLPEWVIDLSLSEHLGRPMSGVFDPAGLALMVLLGAGGLLLGAWAFRRRDLHG